ncbi:hypothetical protein TNIN_13841 [Trichonephila inaurata madagascariensis]|uniref:Uncharacterized protein n=1 Tax=Trichonephila inaurata madagascariensis TaxID=2747483 RepID=A0A8X7CJH4_9ARAC|nr:hypothetical protein TNIN_13841 [Trichonephila inaurata madagascariensis]
MAFQRRCCVRRMWLDFDKTYEESGEMIIEVYVDATGYRSNAHKWSRRFKEGQKSQHWRRSDGDTFGSEGCDLVGKFKTSMKRFVQEVSLSLSEHYKRKQGVMETSVSLSLSQHLPPSSVRCATPSHTLLSLSSVSAPPRSDSRTSSHACVVLYNTTPSLNSTKNPFNRVKTQ